MNLAQKLLKEFPIRADYLNSIIKLIDDGNTIPFIARYRKELTGSMDDQKLRGISERLTYLRELNKRKDKIVKAISLQKKMTDVIEKALDNSNTLTELEDIFRPYKQKRKTRATMAINKGLEPLAQKIFHQDIRTGTLDSLVKPYIDKNKGVNNYEEAIAGATDIIASYISDDADLRKILRTFIKRTGSLTTKAVKKEQSVYEMYYEFSQSLSRIADHRILAIDRGERESYLKVSIDFDKERAIRLVTDKILKPRCITTELVVSAAMDSFARLIQPSLIREIRGELTLNAGTSAIRVFAVNLKNLLMQPPIKGAVTLGLDPAYRTGCKIAVVDGTGKVLDKAVIYPTPPHNKIAEAKLKLKELIAKHHVSLIAIGNGTASRESEIFVAELIGEITSNVSYMIVNEAGASVYSASKLAAKEFPQYDVTIRSAISIARRLQDPLAELVKIDPKSIGVGQYQHDMKKAQLDESLSGVVESCVNTVGVDLNTASIELLSHVSGVGNTIAKNIVEYRDQNGIFKNRKQLLKVGKLGQKAYEQCAGFLRLPSGANILDNTGVHPESYAATNAILDLCGFDLADVKAGKITKIKDKLRELGYGYTAKKVDIGALTLQDIIAELSKPGRDPRDELSKPVLRTDVMDISSLSIGMELMGTVRNVIDFGVFVDIGVHQDGLVHISQICDRFIKHPSEVVKVGDVIKVWVISIDALKKRISLTMKSK